MSQSPRLEETETPFLVEVVCQVEAEDLDAEDRDEAGKDNVGGLYRVTLRAPFEAEEAQRIECVLDAFHDNVPIACLDNYEISVHPEEGFDREASGHDHVREDLGRFDGLREPWRKRLDEPSDADLEAQGIQVLRPTDESPSL